MFDFVENKNNESGITEESINELEKKLKIKFPSILKEYYLKYNDSEIKELHLILKSNVFEYECYLQEIFSLNKGEFNVETQYKWIKGIEYVPKEFVPFASDEGGDVFCWDYSNGKVYYVKMDLENPIYVCENIEKFFDILNKCVKSKSGYVIKDCELFELDDYITVGTTTVDQEIDKVLKFRNSRSVIVFLVLSLLSLALFPVLEELTFFVTALILLYTVVLYLINLVNKIKSQNIIKKYGYDELKKELLSKKTKKIDGIEVYLTDNYIISNHKRIVVVKYSDISWIYLTHLRGSGGIINIISRNILNVVEGSPLKVHLKNGKGLVLAYVQNLFQKDTIFKRLSMKSKNIMFGYDTKKINKYKEICPSYKRKKRLEAILPVIIIIVWLILAKLIFD